MSDVPKQPWDSRSSALPCHVRRECRLCQSGDLERVVEFPWAVPGEHLKASPDGPDPQPIPIDFYQCRKCGHVQILHVPPLEALYNQVYTFMPGNNPDLVEHFRKTIAYFLETFSPGVDFAFELGSNDGVFLDALREKTGCRVLGMDPSLPPAEVARRRGVETLLEFFSLEQARKLVRTYGHPDVVVANNVFAHNDDLRGMIEGIALMLKPGGYLLFEASHLKAVVERFLIGTIIHEHLSIHSLHSLRPCLAEFGLQLVGVRIVEDVQGGALVGIARKEPFRQIPDAVARVIAEEEAAGITTPEGMRRFQQALADKVVRLNHKISSQCGDLMIVGYGAARSAPFIIDVLGLRDRLAFIVDDNPVKRGKFMPVTGIPIVGSDQLDTVEKNFVFVILGWAQTARIIGKLQQLYPHAYAVTIYPEFDLKPLSGKGV